MRRGRNRCREDAHLGKETEFVPGDFVGTVKDGVEERVEREEEEAIAVVGRTFLAGGALLRGGL